MARRGTIQLIEKIGRLTPIRELDRSDNRNRKIWLFRCDCGKEIEKTASDVKQGRVRSCGCLVKENSSVRARENTLPNKQGPFNKLFRRYKREGEERGYKFLLSEAKFKDLINQDCHYCGASPANEVCQSTKYKNPENTLVYNGIDRKDNMQDYTVENCVPACAICNRMKMTLSYNVFLDKIKGIYSFVIKGKQYE